MNGIRRGKGRPILLLHGLGGTWRSWQLVLNDLAAKREVIAVDLPGFGKTPPLKGKVSIAAMADAVTEFLESHDMIGVDVAGSSMGARLALELARRKAVGATVAFSPGGFWQGWERDYAAGSIELSIRVLKLLQPIIPFLASNPLARTVLLSQLSAHPWGLPPSLVEDELRGYVASVSFNELLHDLAYGPEPMGAASGSTLSPITIGWGRKDRLCFPKQAQRALELFPNARLHWFDDCGHFPQWDVPAEAAEVILENSAYVENVEPPARVERAMAVGA
jgi:pimeloyl-ACP methyl ester carboxylesterase